MKKHSFKPRSQFTLIELLTVLAVLAILMAMLFPGLRRAKRQARMLGCIVNMKYQGLCYMAYMDDYDDQFPRAHWTENTTWNIGGQAPTWQPTQQYSAQGLMLNSYAGVDESYVDPNFPASVIQNGSVYHQNAARCTKDAGNPFIFSPAGPTGGGDARLIFNCPGDLGLEEAFVKPYGQPPDEMYYFRYGLAQYAAQGPTDLTWWEMKGVESYYYNAMGNSHVVNGYGLQWVRGNDVADASYTVMAHCVTASGGYSGAFGNHSQLPLEPRYFSYWHSGEKSEGPALFVDGSVRPIRLYNNSAVNTAYNSAVLYGKNAIDPSGWADFNFCFIEFPGADGYPWITTPNVP